MKFKEESCNRTPEVLYEIVVDFGDDGTQTIFSSPKESITNKVLDEFLEGNYSRVDFDKELEEYLVGVSLKQTLEAPAYNMDIVTLGNTQQVMVELYSAKVVE